MPDLDLPQPIPAADWRDGAVYQIYPRSFADSDGNGVGDLQGMIDHLDHLGPDGLGVDAVWLSPFYPSPGHDLGYDVADHTRVDPLFGSEADFDQLVDACHARGLRVIIDLVMNHTSDEHEWFRQSRVSREGPYADYYLWRDPSGWDAAGNPLPPNNWVSFFGGSGWEFEPARQQFYYHTFLVQQPELNWRDPAVEADQWAMVRGWLERGVDGFRLDVFNAFLKDPGLRDNPVLPEGSSPWTRLEHKNDLDHADFADLIARFRAIVDGYADRMSVGELFSGGTPAAARYTSGRHIVFDWSLIEAPWTAAAFTAAIQSREEAYGPDRSPTVALSNHDRERQAGRLAASVGREADSDAIARAAAVLQFGLRGTPFLYYGQEIGMVDVLIPDDEIVDPPARLAGPDFPWYDRSRCRTPMQWAAGRGAGFTSGAPWLRIAPDTDARNVAAQRGDPGSVLETYRRLLAARRESPALRIGRHDWIATGQPDVLAWSRTAGRERRLVVINFAGSDRDIVVETAGDAWAPVAGSHPDPAPVAQDGRLRLRADEAVVFRPATV